MDEDRLESAREVMRAVPWGPAWDAAIETESVSSALHAVLRGFFTAWRQADLEWMLAHVDPALEVVQPREFTDARTYHGPDGMVEALIDWPSAWEHLEIEPRRIFAVSDEHLVTVAIHRGRAHQIETEAEVVWLQRWRDRHMTRWDMFMNVDDALAAARRT